MTSRTVRLDVRDEVGPAERAAVRTLLDAVRAADGARPLSDEGWVAVAAPAGPEALVAAPGSPGGVPGPPAVLLTARPGPGGGGEVGEVDGGDGEVDGGLAGCAVLLPGDGAWALEVAVHPAWCDGDRTVEEQLVRASVGEVAQRGGTAVRLWLRAPPPERTALARRLGFDAERELLQLRVPLPLPTDVAASPRDVRVRPFAPGRDEERWLAANNRAFATHPEQGGWALTDILVREREPWFDPAGFLLHEEDDQVAAFCWTKVHRDSRPPLGEIYVIGVDPAFQGRGLGRALTVAGLEHLAGRGVPVGMLYVDGANAPARALYGSLGFTPHRVDSAYLRRLASGDG
ncbi:MAG: mycothiol synthase [Acidimicrobiales bacterium]